MTVKVRPYKTGGWEVDIVIQTGSGRSVRKRLKSPVSSKSGSLAWGQARERHLIQHGLEVVPPPGPASPGAISNRPDGPSRREAPTLAEFAPRYIDGYARANRQKPSSIDSKLSHLSAHLIPRFGEKRLDELGDEDIQCLKAALADKSAKTVNNVLTTLNTLLSVAVEWGVLERMPAKIRLLKVTQQEAAFYDFDEYERLVEAAAKIDPGVHLQVLLGGDAGLRPGEVRALHWISVDFRRRLTIERSEYKGEFTLPKHDKIRRVPMTDALAEALRAYRHLRGRWCSTATRRAGCSRLVCNATGSARPSGWPTCQARARTRSGTRSAPTWRCEAPRRRQSRNWLDTQIWPPRNGTCTCRPRRLIHRFTCWIAALATLPALTERQRGLVVEDGCLQDLSCAVYAFLVGRCVWYLPGQ